MTASYDVQNHRAKSTLRDQFFLLLAQIDSKAATLRATITALLGLSVPWQEIVEWGALAGKERPVRKLISEILLDLGVRRRNHHGGKPLPSGPLTIMAFALRHFSEDEAPRLLRAAARAAEARARVKHSTGEITVLPDGPQLESCPVRDGRKASPSPPPEPPPATSP